MIALHNPTDPGSRSSSAPDPRPLQKQGVPPFSPVGQRSWLSAQGRLPLAFMGLALAWLAVGTAMIVSRPGILALPHEAPPVVALAHAWVLGFFVTVATGATYQIAPVALGTTLWNERYGWWHFGLHAAAVPGMVISFWRWDMTMLAHFGSALALGIGLFAANTWRTVWKSRQRDAVAWSLVLASGWLTVTVLAGLFVAANRIWHLWSTNPLALLRAHAHIGLIGFFLTLLQGVTFRLLPMFTLGDVPNWRFVRGGLWLSQIGLLGLAPALAFGAGYAAFAAGVVICAGICLSAVAVKQTIGTRKKRRLDPGMRSFLAGGIGLASAALLGLVLIWPTAPWGSAPGGPNAMVYAALVFFGGLLPAISGMLCKVVPFLTWMRAYGPRVGRGPTPAASALTKPHLEKSAFALQGFALIPFLVGTWTLNATALALGAWMLAAGVALFLADMLSVLRHLWRPAAAGAQLRSPPTS